ncbi:class 1 fructose-bisphosphatase [Helicobacter kayseriensis]|uniref:class 1 fructose-bisphosphatase n=1 Tax=Helicobacter kayseriensis TaxID=2905877 RepID=UPI001E4B1C45|nr:class 1 fructose-bisphosphatase [Helicobacter kayseriensis]MCE3046912.1 class 1 fructose-bisphosphatase [Helicobacter kayseriensis]MCE3048428.1 class 1 fructose-bisphosphatase [Helicobacter kayseriensis]
MQKIFDCFLSLGPKIQDLIICGETNYTSHVNSSGDTQLALDVQSDLMIERELSNLACVYALFSEEQEKVRIIHKEGEYSVAYDPIDGSSLLDSNLSVGTIFGIYAKDFEGKNLVASGYILYGPRLEIVIAQKDEVGVRHLRFDPKKQEWREQERLFLAQKGKINASGGTQKYWSNQHQKMILSLFQNGYRLRYSGGMVPDLHQILVKGGGLFSYPATQDAPQGKLRKLFEVFPFALIFECAGGEAIDGKSRLLDLGIQTSHESCPCFFGSKEEIGLVREMDGGK